MSRLNSSVFNLKFLCALIVLSPICGWEIAGAAEDPKQAAAKAKSLQDAMMTSYSWGAYPDAKTLEPGKKWYCAKNRIDEGEGKKTVSVSAADVRSFLKDSYFGFQFKAGAPEKLYGPGQTFTNSGHHRLKSFSRNVNVAALMGNEPGYPENMALIKMVGDGVLVERFTSRGSSETLETCYSETKLKSLLGKTYGCTPENAANVLRELDLLLPEFEGKSKLNTPAERLATLEKRRKEDLAKWSTKKDCSPTLEQKLTPEGTAGKKSPGSSRESSSSIH